MSEDGEEYGNENLSDAQINSIISRIKKDTVDFVSVANNNDCTAVLAMLVGMFAQRMGSPIIVRGTSPEGGDPVVVACFVQLEGSRVLSQESDDAPAT